MTQNERDTIQTLIVDLELARDKTPVTSVYSGGRVPSSPKDDINNIIKQLQDMISE